MNNENLLRPMRDQTAEERRESASKAGKASGVARRKKRNMREMMKLILELPANDTNAEAVKELLPFPEDEELTNLAVLTASLWQQANEGNAKSAEIIADLYGTGIKYDELKEKKRANKAQEKLREKELELREKQIDVMASGAGADSSRFCDIVEQMSFSSGKGLTE